MAELDSERDERLAHVVEEARAELRDGGMVDAAVLRARYPELADELPVLLETADRLSHVVALCKTPSLSSDWAQPTPAESPLPPGEANRGEATRQFGRYL